MMEMDSQEPSDIFEEEFERIMSTKTRFRWVFTVQRPLGTMTLREAVEETQAAHDDGFYEHIGSQDDAEKSSLRLEMWDKDNKRWMEVLC